MTRLRSPSPPRRRACAIAALAVVVAMGGCSSVVVPERAPRPPSADERAAAPADLATERRWLQSWFQGTPVSIAQGRDGAVSIQVPREFCFEAGRNTVKPALAAVLDKTAESLRRVSGAYLPLLAAPADAGGTSTLAMQRAEQVRKYLLSRGVPAARLGAPSTATAQAVQLRLQVAPK